LAAFSPKRDAEDDFLAVFRDRAEAQSGCLLYFGDIADADRRVLARRDDDIFDVRHARYPAKSAHQELFLAAIDVLAADLPVVRIDRLDDLAEAEPVFDQPTRVDLDLVLLFESTPGHDIVDAGRGTQQQSNGPILQGAQVHVGEFGIGRFDRVPEHLSQARRVGSKFGLAVSGGQAGLGLDQLLAYEPAGKIDVSRIGEVDCHVGEAE
jgi:hypothetical protein